jgi:hypothetical protein
MERVKGIEPSSSAWKAVALPLSYTRNCNDLKVAKAACANGSSPCAGLIYVTTALVV